MRPAAVILLVALQLAAQTRVREVKKLPPKPAAPKPTATTKPTVGGLDIPKLPDVQTNIVNTSPSAKQPAADPALGLKPAPLRDFSPLPVRELTLPNGMRVILHEDRRAPWIAGLVRFDAGTAHDPPLKAGLAELTIRAMRAGGPEGADPTAHQRQLESLGAVLQADSGERVSSLSFRTMPASLGAVLELLHGTVTRPSFDEDAIEESRAALRNRAATRNNTIESIVERELRAAALGGWLPPRVEYSTLANCGQDDLRAFHRQHMVPATTTLLMTGDFDSAALAAGLQQSFGSWKATAAAAAKAADPAAPPAPSGVRFAELQRAQAAGFALGRTAPALGSPDSAAAAVLVELLTGGTSGRIHQLSQRQQSWMMRANAGLDQAIGRPALFTIRGLTDTPYPVDAIIGILADAAEIRKGNFPDAAALLARKQAMSAWLGQFQTPLARIVFDESARRAGLSAGFAAAHFKALAAVGKPDIVRAAQTLLDPQSLHAVIGANSTLLNRPLSEFREPSVPVDLSIPVSQPLQADASPAAVAKGKEWLARMQTALGGAAKLAAVKDLVIVSKGTHGDAPITMTDRWLAPGTIRQDQETKAGVMSVFYNGEIGWIGSPGRIAPLSPALLLQVRGELLRLLPLLATSDRDPKRTVSHAGSNVLVIAGDKGTAVRVYVDEATSLPARLVYQGVNAAGLPAMSEETWSDWTESGGIKFPGRIQLRVDGRRAGELEVTSVKVDSGIKISDIERKP